MLNITTVKLRSRVCHFYDGSSLKETIINYVPNQGYSFELSAFSLPLKSATS